jgi:hypothetical protein
MLYSSVRFLHISNGVPKASTYLSVVSTTLWKHWNMYWELATQDISPAAISNLHSLLPLIISLTDGLIPNKTDRK